MRKAISVISGCQDRNVNLLLESSLVIFAFKALARNLPGYGHRY